jgi:hypothetical protein
MNPDQRQRLLTYSAAAIIGLWLADAWVLTPLVKGWQSRSKDVADLRKKIADGKQKITRVQPTNAKWNDYRKNMLPANASEAEQTMLKEFDKWAKDSGISVSSLKPQWKRGADDEYSVLECRLDASGRLSTLTRFMYELERSPMALKVESLEISAQDTSGSQMALGLVVTGLRLAHLEEK